MPSSKEFLDFVLEQLSGLPDISYRAMMGEYVIYCQGKVVGGIYDDRFLVKPTPSAKRLLPDGVLELPYPGGKEMLLADVDDRDFLESLIPAVAADLPEPKKPRQKVGPLTKSLTGIVKLPEGFDEKEFISNVFTEKYKT